MWRQNVKAYCANFNFPIVVKVQLMLYVCEIFIQGSSSTFFVNEYIFRDETDVIVLGHATDTLEMVIAFVSSILTDYKFGRFRMTIFMYVTYFFVPLINFGLSFNPTWKYTKPLFFVGFGVRILVFGITAFTLRTFTYDQFKLPEMQKMFEIFIIMDMIISKISSIIGTFIVPHFRNLSCLNLRYCFPLVFGLLTLRDHISAVAFFSLMKYYKRTYPLPERIKEYTKCVLHAIKNRRKMKAIDKKKHWLDYADDEYSPNVIADLKICAEFFKILFISAIMHFSYGVTQTIWLFQARRMDGDVGIYTLLPDQIYFVKDVFMLVFFPTMRFVIIPGLARKNMLTNYLHRYEISILLCVVALACSGVCLLFIEARQPILPSEAQGHISVFNSFPCDISIESSVLDPPYTYIPKFGYHRYEMRVIKFLKIPYTIKGACVKHLSNEFIVEELKQKGYYFQNEQTVIPFDYSLERHPHAHNKLFTCFSVETKSLLNESVQIWDKSGYFVCQDKVKSHRTQIVDKLRDLEIRIGNFSVHDFYLHSGGVNAVIGKVYKNKTVDLKIHRLTRLPVNMLYFLPQIIMVEISYFFVFISLSVLKYSGVPPAVRSTVFGLGHIMNSVGSSLISVYAKIKTYKESSKVFFVTVLTFFTFLLLIYLVRNYELPHFNEEENRQQRNVNENEEKNKEKDMEKSADKDKENVKNKEPTK